MKVKDGIPFNPYGLFHGIFIPNGIKKSNKRLTTTAKLLMGQLLHYSGKNGKAFPSRKKLCEDLEISMSALDRAIKLLKKEKFIKTFQKDTQSPSTYIFLNN